METILHIGAHRTATTTLQSMLQRHRMALGQAGVAVWGPDRTRGGLFAGLIHRPDTISEQIEWQAHRSLGLIVVERERLIQRGTRQLIVTEENMLGTIRANLREGCLYPLADERLRRFVPAFAPGLRRVVLGLRDYAGFWASHLAYGLTQAERPIPDPAMLWRLVEQPRRWRDVIADIHAIFPGVEVMVWLHEEMAADPLGQIALLTGGVFLRDDGAPAPRHNQSPGRNTLRHLLRLRGQAGQAARLPEGDGRWEPFDAAMRARLDDLWAQDLDWLRAGADGMARLVGQDTLNNKLTGWNQTGGGDARPGAGGQDEQRQRAVV